MPEDHRSKNAHCTDCITDTAEGHPGQSGDVGAYSITVCTTEGNRTKIGRSPPEKRAVLFVLQHEKGIPDNRVTSEPIAVLFVLQTQEEGVPDNRERERRRGEGRKE